MSTVTSLDELAQLVRRTREAQPGQSRFVVGIVGPPGSGKSTIGEQLVARLGESAALLGMDGFHLPQARLVELGRRERMGAADTFDIDGFLATLAGIRAGGTVTAPGFDRAVEEATPGAIVIPASATTVVVEGNYLLHDADGWEPVAPLLDLGLFVRLDREERLRRLVARHVRFGKTPDAAAAWAHGPDERNARLIDATAPHADHTIDLGGPQPSMSTGLSPARMA